MAPGMLPAVPVEISTLRLAWQSCPHSGSGQEAQASEHATIRSLVRSAERPDRASDVRAACPETRGSTLWHRNEYITVYLWSFIGLITHRPGMPEVEGGILKFGRISLRTDSLPAGPGMQDSWVGTPLSCQLMAQ